MDLIPEKKKWKKTHINIRDCVIFCILFQLGTEVGLFLVAVHSLHVILGA